MSELAKTYHYAVKAAELAAVDGEPEAQLTSPVANLFEELANQADLGTLNLIRETRTGKTRPDFAALLTRGRKTMQKGFIELKAPHVPISPETWTGRNAKQWEKMKDEAEILILCNGREARLYRYGIEQGPAADLPYDTPDNWDSQPLTDLLRRFFELNPSPVTTIADLTRRLAVRTRDLRDRIEWLMHPKSKGLDPEARKATLGSYAAWQKHVYPHASQRDFADGMAQVIGYGMVLAALTPGDADTDGDGHLSVIEARDAIRDMSPVLAAAFAPLIDKPILKKATQVEVGALETLVSAIDKAKVSAGDKRGDAWLGFYEDFLEVYDPDERREAGVYYTPVAAVSAMTAMTGHLLINRLGKRMGFGDSSVVTLDPATGTGTFPLAAIDHAVNRAPEVRGDAGVKQAARNLASNMFAFELLPGPYAVAHLRLSQRLSKLADERTLAQVVLTDTLEAPDEPSDMPSELFGDPQILAEEQERANRIKRNQKVTVVIGNPPYRRVAKDLEGRGSGGWVVDGEVPNRSDSENSLFDDILDVAKANTIFSHHASLYNLYVYFWRWSLWKAFEAHGDDAGVISLITASSWLDGPGFVGLRQLARELADEIWVVDLGGDNRGTNPEDNIFAIETPVSIVTLVRGGKSDRRTPARTHYRRIRGTSEGKLETLRGIAASDDPFSGDWQSAPSDWLAPMLPPTGDAGWTDMPLITDVFPWQQPGCMHSRTWPIAPDKETLRRRWERFVGSSAKERGTLYVTPNHGRDIHTKVSNLKPLAELDEAAPHQPITCFGMRAFDRQWSFDDPRLAKTDSPSLWQSVSMSQIFLASLLTHPLGHGPSITATVGVPDKHFFRGSYGGKDIIPLYRDAEANEPNLTEGLSATLGQWLGIDPPSVEDVACYCYALLAHPAYQQRFADALERPGLRVPITADAELWAEAVEQGRYLLWLHTYAERLVDPDEGRGAHVPMVDGLGWSQEVAELPQDSSNIEYDPEKGTLEIGDGIVTGVRPEVWEFSISGMQVVPKWLGYRTRKGAGRATSSDSALDKIRPDKWADEWNDELLDLLRILTITVNRHESLADLLARICDGELISADDLPQPKDAQRKVPATIR